MAHKNSLRALFKHLQDIGEDEIKKIDVPNAQPIVYEFDQRMTYIKNYILTQNESHIIN